MTRTAPRAQPLDWRTTLPLLLLVLAVALYALYFGALTLQRFRAFEARALDMGNLNQAIWNTAHGDWFRQTNQPGATNRLSLHVEPILLPIALLYRLAPGPEFLLLLQAVVVALGALPLYALGTRLLRSKWLALLFAVAWLTMPAVQAANWLEFHPLTLAPTFLMAAFYFLVTRRAGWYALFALLAATCKEDIGLLVFMLGLYALVVQRRRRLGLLSMALGLGWSLVAVLVVQQSFGGNIHWNRYAYLGETPLAMVRTLVTQPGLIWAQLQRANAAGYLFELLLPVGFLALLAPEVLLLALPSLGVNLLADFPPMHEVDTLIYAMPVAPFVALAAVVGTARMLAWLRRPEAGTRARRAAPWAVAALLLACVLLAQALYGYLPGGPHARLYRVSEHDRLAHQFLEQIGRGEAVSAQDKLNPHTSGRYTSYIFPRVLDAETGDADVAFLDVGGPSWPQHPNDVYASVQTLLEAGYGVADAAHGYLLLRRGAPAEPFPPAFYSLWHAGADERPTLPQRAQFGPGMELLGIDLVENDQDELIVRSHWRTPERTPEPLTVRLIYRNEAGETLYDSRLSPPVATLWYPTTQWPPGETAIVAAVPWQPTQARFTLLLGVHSGDDPDAGRLPVVASEPPQPVLEEGTLLRLGGFERTRSGWTQVQPLAARPAALDAHFDGGITLENASVAPPARRVQTATVTLQWSLSPGQEAAQTGQVRDPSVFVHLLDASGEKRAQWDGPPRDAFGPLPAGSWPAGPPIVGTYPLPLPADLPPGDYRVVAGLWDWQAGQRLPAQGSSTLADGTVEVGTVRIE